MGLCQSADLTPRTWDRSSHLWRVLCSAHTTGGTWGPCQAYSRAPRKVKGSPRTGQGCHFLWGAATVNYVNRICNPKSNMKQLSPKAAFYSSQSISFSFSLSSGTSELDSESTLSLIQANIAMKSWDGHWWAPKVGAYCLCLKSEFSWERGMRRKEKHWGYFHHLYDSPFMKEA